MKVLFTGTSSAHCSKPSNVGFFSLLSEVVSEFAEVTWAAPKLSWTKETLESFDYIFLGVTPPTALSANKVYGAFHVLGLMYHSPKLRLVVDSQQVWQYKNSIEAVKRSSNTLFSSFYSKRNGYTDAQGDAGKQIRLACEYMSSGYWPTTYVPVLPWGSTESVSTSLGFIPKDRIYGVNLDSLTIMPEPYTVSTRSNTWSVEDKSRAWFKNLESSLSYETVDVRLGRKTTDLDSLNTIRSSVGLIVPPQDRKTGTWWSYKYVQALNSNTPIVTLWQESSKLGPAWSHLAYQIEDMTDMERRNLAKDQLDSYQSLIKTKSRIIEDIRNEMLESSQERI